MTANDHGNEPTGTDDFEREFSEWSAARELVTLDLDPSVIEYHLFALGRRSAEFDALLDESATAADLAAKLRAILDDAARVGDAPKIPSAMLGLMGVDADELDARMAVVIPSSAALVLYEAHLALLEGIAHGDEPTDAVGEHMNVALTLELSLVDQAPATVAMLDDTDAAETVDRLEAIRDESAGAKV